MNVHFASVSKPPHAMQNGHSSPPKFESLNLQVIPVLQPSVAMYSAIVVSRIHSCHVGTI